MVDKVVFPPNPVPNSGEINLSPALSQTQQPNPSALYITVASTENRLFTLLSHTTQYYPIHHRICSLLEITDLLALRRTAKQFYALYADICRTQWSINSRLRAAFDDPVAFRNLQAQTKALLNGRIIESFFERAAKTAVETDPLLHALEIYVPEDGEQLMLGYLRGEGYEVINELDSASTDAAKLLLLEKPANRFRSAIHIGVVTCRGPPIFSIFKQHLHIALMNFVSWNKAYSLFPVPTFIMHETYMLLPDEQAAAAATDSEIPGVDVVLRALTDRGFTTKNVYWQEAEAGYGHSSLMTQRRQVGDKHSWIMNLDTTGIQPADVPDFVLESSCFRLHVAQDRINRLYCYRLDTRLLSACTLKYQYLVPVEEYSTTNIQERLNQATVVELLKMKPETRPSESQQIMADVTRAHEFRVKFPVPSTWVYYDKEMPAWLVQVQRWMAGTD